MPANLTLGAVMFNGMELPSQMPFGGAQKLNVHRLPGGGRVIDAMGSDDPDVAWAGHFIGASAVSRARTLDAMRAAGTQFTLSWSDFRRQAVISSFTPDWSANGNLLPYSITLVLLPDATPATASTSQAASTQLLTGADDPALEADLAAALYAATTAIGAFGAFSGSGSAASAAASSVSAALALAVSTQGAAETSLAGASSDDGKPPCREGCPQPDCKPADSQLRRPSDVSRSVRCPGPCRDDAVMVSGRLRQPAVRWQAEPAEEHPSIGPQLDEVCRIVDRSTCCSRIATAVHHSVSPRSRDYRPGNAAVWLGSAAEDVRPAQAEHGGPAHSGHRGRD